VCSSDLAAASKILTEDQPDKRFELQHAYLQALAAVHGGDASPRVWHKVVSFEPQNAQEAELIAAAGLAMAAAQIEAGQDPVITLENIQGNSVSALKALQARARLALAAGDTVVAVDLLGEVSLRDSQGPEFRRSQQLAGQLASSQHDWQGALEQFDSVLTNWDHEAAWLQALLAPEQADAVWKLWRSERSLDTEIPWPQLAWNEALASAAKAATNLTEMTPPTVGHLSSLDSSPARLNFAQDYKPSSEQWLRWSELTQADAQAQADLRRWNRDLVVMKTDRREQLSYLDLGITQTGFSTTKLTRSLNELDMMLANLSWALAALDSTKDKALFLFAQRTATLVAELQTSFSYVQAARHFHVDGPNSLQYKAWPVGAPTPATILDLEEALTMEMVAFLQMFNARVPDLVNRSCDEIWRPRLEIGTPALQLALLAQRHRSLVLAADLDSTTHALAIDGDIAATHAKVARGVATADSLTIALSHLETEITAAVVATGKSRLDAEREGIDYQRHNALYWLAVAEAKQADSETVITSLAPAMEAMDNYLEQYPESRARGATRFRLADLSLLQARVDFRVQKIGRASCRERV